jgi:hypothetical protein
VQELLTLAMMCKAMKCTPSELRKEDYEEITYLTHIYTIMSKKNPMNFFGG